MNKVCRKVELDATYDYCDKCSDEECKETITPDNPML